MPYLAAACILAAQTPQPAPDAGGEAPATPDVLTVSPLPLPATAAETLRTVAEVRQIGSAQAGAIHPIQLQGVVTFVHAERATFFLSDATGGVAVGLAYDRMTLPAVGDLVKLTGFTEPGPRIPFVRTNAIVKEGTAALPPTREISFPQAMTGAEEYQWVELCGQLVRNESLDDWQRLTLAAQSGEFTVNIPTTARHPATAGAFLRVRGVCNTWGIPGTSRIGGIFVFSPTLSEARVIEEGPVGADTLTLVLQVQRLRAEEAAAGRPVRLRGVVTFVHPDQRIFYLNDATGGVLVWLEKSTDALPPAGAVAFVRGVTSAGTFTAAVRGDQIQTAGQQAMPVARAISLEQALTGSEDGQWVEMRGHLRQVEAVGDWLRLTLSSAVGEFTVSIPHTTPTEAKVGSFLVVRGVCQAWLDDKQKIGGVFLYVPSLDHLEVEEKPLADPFAVPEETIDRLQLYRTQTLQQLQVRISGTVLYHVPGRYVVVGNVSGVVRALSRDKTPLRPGDRVEVAGIPGRQGNRSVLRGAVYRRTGSGPAPAPLAPLGDLNVLPALEGRLVTVAGRLVNVLWRPEDTRLMVQTDGPAVEIMFEDRLPAGIAAEWARGSTVEITGLYCVEYDEDDQPMRFSLQLRSPADVVVRERPSWWTVGRALTALGVIAGCLVFGLAWVAALRRQVVQQTGIIRAQLEKEKKLEDLNRQMQKSESLGHMAAAIAHHFNNQLQSVMMGLEMALHELPLDAASAEILSSAQKSARKAAEMSTLMLTYLGQFPGEKTSQDLAEACRRGLPQLQSGFSGKAVLESSLPSPGPVIRANAVQIQQALANLVANAREALGDSGGVVRLAVATVAAEGIPAGHRFPVDFRPQDTAYACIEVSDTGCGIPGADLGRIFDPFFTTKFPGRGMGLAVVLGIARAHDGVVAVESEPGRGSVLRLYVPVTAGP